MCVTDHERFWNEWLLFNNRLRSFHFLSLITIFKGIHSCFFWCLSVYKLGLELLGLLFLGHFVNLILDFGHLFSMV